MTAESAAITYARRWWGEMAAIIAESFKHHFKQLNACIRLNDNNGMEAHDSAAAGALLQLREIAYKAAARKNREQDKQLAALKEAQRWRIYPEEKPEDFESIIFANEDGEQHSGHFCTDCFEDFHGYIHHPDTILFWMPIPEAPKEDGK